MVKMAPRTKTYIAGDWDGDREAIQKLYDWNASKSIPIYFINAHDLTQARDSSLNCSIKQSLKTRLDASKRFILIVGEKTASLRSGGCHLCPSYNSYGHYCVRRYYVQPRDSFRAFFFAFLGLGPVLPVGVEGLQRLPVEIRVRDPVVAQGRLV